MVQNGVRVSTFSDNTASTRRLTYFAHMLGKQFPSRGRRRQWFARNERVERSFSGLGRTLVLPLCIALNACGGPSWPGGIHAVLAASPRGLRVVQVPADSPARRAGLEE